MLTYCVSCLVENFSPLGKLLLSLVSIQRLIPDTIDTLYRDKACRRRINTEEKANVVAVQAWSPWTAAGREVLEQVQKRAIRMVSGLRGRDYKERLAELNLTTLEERRH